MIGWKQLNAQRHGTRDRVGRLEELARAIETARVGPHIVRAGAVETKAELIALRGEHCEGCFTAMPESRMMHMHHVKPVSKGGTNIGSNVALLCPNCHAIAHWIDRNAPEAERPTDAPTLITALRAHALQHVA